MSEPVIRVEHVSKEYRLGAIGGTTLRADLQRAWAKLRHKEDPNSKIGSDQSHIGEKFLALDDVSFEVQQGEALGIIGHNGAGKSTLLKLLSRVTAPTKGRIMFKGRIASMLEVGTGFHGELTGRENVYMNGAILGMTKKEITRKMDEIVSFAEMEQFIDTPVKRYSSGMYVKLAFSVAAHLDAEIMIMDEVLAVGDMKFQQKCLGRMSDAANNEGRTVLYVSHNMGTIRQLCRRGLVLDHGHIVHDGNVEKAIGIYAGSASNTMMAHINFYDAAYKPFNIHSKIFLKSADILAQDCVLQSCDTSIGIRLNISALSPINEIFIFSVLQDFQGHPLGFSISNGLSFSHPGDYVVKIRLPLKNLMGGQYRVRFVLFQSVQRKPQVWDRTEAAIIFLKLDNPLAINTEYVQKVHGCFNLGNTEAVFI